MSCRNDSGVICRNHRMVEPVGSDLVSRLRNLFDQGGMIPRDPSKDEKRTPDVIPVEKFQQSCGVFFNTRWEFVPILFRDQIRKRLDLEIFLDIDGESVRNRSWTFVFQEDRFAIRRQWGLPRPAPQEDDLEGVEEDQEVQLERHVLEVEKVVLELFLRLVDRAAVMEHDLRPSGDPGFDRVAEGVIRDHGLKFLNEFRTLRTGAHEFQFSDQDVEQLRQFVDPRFSEEVADPRDPGIVLHRPYRIPVFFRVVPHRTEFVDPDRFVVLPHPDLGIENGAGRVEFDEDRNDEKNREQEDQEDGGDDRAQDPADREKNPGFPEPFVEDEEGRGKVVDRDPAGELLEEPRPFDHLVPTHPERQHFLDGVLAAPFRDRHDDLVDVIPLDDPIHLRGIAEDFPDLRPVWSYSFAGGALMKPTR